MGRNSTAPDHNMDRKFKTRSLIGAPSLTAQEKTYSNLLETSLDVDGRPSTYFSALDEAVSCCDGGLSDPTKFIVEAASLC